MPGEQNFTPDEQQQKIGGLLENFYTDPGIDAPAEAQLAVQLARLLQERANELQTSQERRQQAELDRMIQNPGDKHTMMKMTDQAFRSHTPQRSADQLIHILDAQGIPRFFSPLDRTLLKGFQSFGEYLPGVAMPMVKQKMRRESSNVILPAERELLTEHLAARRDEGVRMNVNFLGEALLGETDAQQRFHSYLQALQLPEIEVMSVKISTIYSQISPLAHEHTVHEISERLELLYRAAARSTFTRSDGTVVPKFLYLDMEEYRDLSLTADAFMQTLDLPGLEHVAAGIVLQAYIPDSFRMQQRLNEWARKRVENGGAPITIRIVKGANMEMERVEASLHGWPQAPYQQKMQTDANYKRMLQEGMQPKNIGAVRLGIASHNLFDLAYGLVLAAKRNTLSQVQFEMLEGMANPQRRALFELSRNMLLYAPACKQEDFVNAIGYLVRRLDENTGQENFLRHAFKLKVGSEDWEELEQGFLDSFKLIDTLPDAPRRTQDRRDPIAFEEQHTTNGWQNFHNEPDTDFCLPQNTLWAKDIIQTWLEKVDNKVTDIPLVINGAELRDGREVRESFDPSRPKMISARYRQANSGDVKTAMGCATSDDDGWRELSASERQGVMRKVAHELRNARGDLMGAAMIDGGKTLTESDPEVSEAIDFVEFYSQTAKYFSELPGIIAEGQGVVVVVSPWNFPIAIPCGGIGAALAAGNTVILKPASDTVLSAYELCKCFWRGGVSQKTLQFFPCSGATVGAELVSHPEVNTVILTGGTETALSMLGNHPTMNLLAETGGKNATIVTALADRDLAIKNVLHSAFGHSGQKCSATSLLILEDEVFQDDEFRTALCDAVKSLRVGPANELQTKMGPLIRPPSGDLERGLKELETGETWAVLPREVDDNPCLYSPGVKWDVTPGSYTHMTEFFGPVLAVMSARHLHEAINMTNATGFGLTSGLESLDDREQEEWLDNIRAGNLYLNRGTTGAIVLRQPFGGMGKSAFGPGIKAGGPNYVAQLMHFEETETNNEPVTNFEDENNDDDLITEFARKLQTLPDCAADFTPAEIQPVLTAIASYQYYHRTEFGQEHDHFRLVGQDNIRRYLPVRELRVRVHPDDTFFEIFARVAAAKVAGCRITVSYPADGPHNLVSLLDDLTESWAGGIEFVEEDDDQLARIILQHDTDRVRYSSAGRVPLNVRQAAPQTQIFLADAPVRKHGRIELLWYLQEQSLCINYHRYGNLGARANEPRANVL